MPQQRDGVISADPDVQAPWITESAFARRPLPHPSRCVPQAVVDAALREAARAAAVHQEAEQAAAEAAVVELGGRVASAVAGTVAGAVGILAAAKHRAAVFLGAALEVFLAPSVRGSVLVTIWVFRAWCLKLLRRFCKLIVMSML